MIQVFQPSLTRRHSRIFYSKETVTHIYPPTTSAGMAVSYGANRPSDGAVAAAVSTCGGHGSCFRLLIGPVIQPVASTRRRQ